MDSLLSGKVHWLTISMFLSSSKTQSHSYWYPTLNIYWCGHYSDGWPEKNISESPRRLWQGSFVVKPHWRVHTNVPGTKRLLDIRVVTRYNSWPRHPTSNTQPSTQLHGVKPHHSQHPAYLQYFSQPRARIRPTTMHHFEKTIAIVFTGAELKVPLTRLPLASELVPSAVH